MCAFLFMNSYESTTLSYTITLETILLYIKKSKWNYEEKSKAGWIKFEAQAENQICSVQLSLG